jgi:hypothetical protein
MIINAIITNTISNTLHASFLLIYLVSGMIHYLKKDNTFSLTLILMIFTMFILKCLGIYVHYYDSGHILSPAWVAISLLTIMLNYFIIESIKMDMITKILVMFLSVGFSFLFLTYYQGVFIYLSLAMIFSYIITSYYLKSLARVSFLMIIGSNIIWITLRVVGYCIMGHNIDPIYRYDNDVYHLLLIISTFVLYKSITKGYWRE